MSSFEELKRTYKAYLTSAQNPYPDNFAVWSLMCVNYYGCVIGDALIKEAWNDFRAELKKVRGKKRFKKRKSK